MERQGASGEQIVLSSAQELQRWRAEFGCGEAELLHALWKVGPDAEAVRRFLDQKLHDQQVAQQQGGGGIAAYLIDSFHSSRSR
jgi:Protein of unknown function (DUF3606)